MTTTYSRVTVIGQRRRMDAVLPLDEPLGRLLPDLLRMLDEPLERTPRRRFLTTASGDLVAPESSLGSARLTDGAVLRLAAEGELPPAPTVYDVTEEAVDDLGRRPATFETEHRRILAGAALVIAVLAAAIALVTRVEANLAVFLLFLTAVVTGLFGCVLGRYERPVVAVPLLSIATGTVAGALGVWAASADWGVWLVVGAAAAGLGIGALLFAVAGLARGGVVGGTVAVLLAGAWVGGVRLGIEPDRVAVVLGVVSVLLLGVLPRAALAVSGLTALDDQRAAGQEIGREDVRAALNATHLGLALATVAIAASAAAAGAVMLPRWSGWTVSIAILMAFLLASRSRLYPLLVEVAVLCTASLATLLVLTYELSVQETGGALIAVGILIVVAMIGAFGLGPNPPEHVRARFAQVLDTVEVIAVIAMVPLALGAFGVFSDLLTAV